MMIEGDPAPPPGAPAGPVLHPSRAGTLHLLGNHPVLDFTNTSSGRGGAHWLDHLQQPSHLAVWAVHAGLLPSGQALPDLTAADLVRAVRLREALYRTLVQLSRRVDPDPDDVTAIVTEHGRCLSVAVLRATGGAGQGPACGWGWPDGGVAAILGPLVKAALPLLTDLPPERLRCCPGQDCGWLFLDTTRNGRRRWCDMAVCGNRAKAGRHRATRKATAGQERAG